MISLHRITAAQRGSSIPTPPTPEAPTVQAKNLSFSNLDRTKLTLSVERGNGEAVMIVARAGQPITHFPIDGQEYEANSIYGRGDEVGLGNYVVYNGTGNQVEITGFRPDEEIYFRAFERNGTSYNTIPIINNPNTQNLPEFPLKVYEAIATDFSDWIFASNTNGAAFVSGINHGEWGNPEIAHINAPSLDTSKNAMRLTRANGEALKFSKLVEYKSTHEIALVMEIIGPASHFVRNFHVANVSEGSSFLTIDSNEQLSVNKTPVGVYLPENTKFALRIHMENGENKSFVQINKGTKTFFTVGEQKGNETLWVGSKHTASNTLDGWLWAIGEHNGPINDADWNRVVDYYI